MALFVAMAIWTCSLNIHTIHSVDPDYPMNLCRINITIYVNFLSDEYFEVLSWAELHIITKLQVTRSEKESFLDQVRVDYIQ